jgi:spermidine/putrescine transport system substrate-binding protein
MKKVFLVFFLMVLPTIVFAAKQEVFVFNWSEYVDPSVLKQFEKETGIKVNYSTYDSNEAMFAKLKVVQKAGYDVVFPSSYFVDRMRRMGMFTPLDKSKIPNLKNINPDLLNKSYDPNNTYSVPYMWGASGIGVNDKFVDPRTITSWNDIWNPKFKGKVLLMDDVRDAFGMALRSLGYSCNDTNPDHIKKAYERLKILKPSVKVFNSDSPRQPFLNKEVIIGQIWGGEVYQANKENQDIKFIYPKEGAVFWIDNMAVPKNARNLANAYAFINFLCRPEIAKKNCEFIGYATANAKAQQMLDPKTRNHKAVYPDEATLKKGEFQTDVGDAIMTYEKYWEMLKTQ